MVEPVKTKNVLLLLYSALGAWHMHAIFFVFNSCVIVFFLVLKYALAQGYLLIAD